jgi:carbon monoxide dehydrogenase subunit G
MGISIAIEINREFDVAAGIDQAFALLSDVPKSASHFPKVDQLIDMENNVYRWEMEKIGVDRHALQTIYACKYEADPVAKIVTWTPVKEVGNGQLRGSWRLSPKGSGTHLVFSTQGTLTLALPALLKLAISPVVKHEFNALVDKYISNLQKTLTV